MTLPPTILCFGEALWDVRSDGRTPGGAPMNVALRLASLGGIATDEAPQVPGAGLAVVYGSLAARSITSRQTLLGLLDTAPLRVFDANLRPPHAERSVIESLLQRANWAKLNQDELDVIAGWHGWTGSLDALLHRLADHYRLDCVCVTLGAHGAVMLRDGRLHRQAGFGVPVVDTIGCGDSFLASWLLDLLQGSDPGRALRRACALGALVAAEAAANPAVDAARVAALAGP